MITLAAAASPSRLNAAEEARPAARLDGTVITETQINIELDKSGWATPSEKQAVLERLITRSLMARQAIREKLDQEPRVIAAIEAANEKILAQAYLEKQARTVAQPASAIIQAYYDENPALFGERAIYELQQINIQAGPTQLPAVNEQYRRIKTLNEMVDWLKANDIAHRSSVSVKAAEDLPSDLLKPVAQLKPGQVIKVTTSRGLALLQLTGKRSEPLTLPEAKPKIERYLMNQALGEKMGQVVSRLRKEATIEYYPPYIPPN
jgi:EpsD family peptidyl-prolyl cis-trans isomerase